MKFETKTKTVIRVTVLNIEITSPHIGSYQCTSCRTCVGTLQYSNKYLIGGLQMILVIW